MMLRTKPWLYGKLSSSTALTTLLGSADNIIDAWPETITTFPLVIYQDDNQADFEFSDNKPNMSAVRFRLDIFTLAESGYPTTTAIGEAVYNIMNAEFFDCGTNGEVYDDVPNVRHRVMRFSREVFPSDIQ